MSDTLTVSLERILAKLTGNPQKSKRSIFRVMTDLANQIVTNGLTSGSADASATVKGIVELATAAEAQATTDTVRAVTPAGVGQVLSKVIVMTFAGVAAAGPCTATGLKVGDKVLSVAGTVTLGNLGSKFESTVTVNDQIQQTAAEDLSLEKPVAIVYRPTG